MITPRSVVLAALLVAAIAPPASAQELVVGIFGGTFADNAKK